MPPKEQSAGAANRRPQNGRMDGLMGRDSTDRSQCRHLIAWKLLAQPYVAKAVAESPNNGLKELTRFWIERTAIVDTRRFWLIAPFRRRHPPACLAPGARRPIRSLGIEPQVRLGSLCEGLHGDRSRKSFPQHQFDESFAGHAAKKKVFGTTSDGEVGEEPPRPLPGSEKLGTIPLIQRPQVSTRLVTEVRSHCCEQSLPNNRRRRQHGSFCVRAAVEVTPDSGFTRRRPRIGPPADWNAPSSRLRTEDGRVNPPNTLRESARNTCFSAENESRTKDDRISLRW